MDKALKTINIVLIAAVVILGGYTVWKRFAAPLGDAPSEAAAQQAPVDSAIPVASDIRAIESLDTVKSESAKPSPVSHSRKEPPQTVSLRETDLERIRSGNPLYEEARKVLEGGLSETDSLSRRRILNYCEHLRTSYTTKDLDFLRQVFSDNALIIVGHSVRTGRKGGLPGGSQRVRYILHTKSSYLERLEQVFDANKKIDVTFSGFRIMRHPTVEGIYGVTLRQQYKSDLYSDDGWLFLLWDFRDPTMPQIHVRTWQPSESLNSPGDRIDISDFDLQ